MCAGEQESVFIYASLSFSFLFFFFFLFCRTTLFSVISICCDKAASSFSRNGPLQIMSVIPNRGAKADFAPPPRPFSLQPSLILPRLSFKTSVVKKRRREGSNALGARGAPSADTCKSKKSFRELSTASSPGIGLVDIGEVKEVFSSVREAFTLLNFCFHSLVT